MREKNKKVMGINGTQIKQKNRKREKCIYRNGYDGGTAAMAAALVYTNHHVSPYAIEKCVEPGDSCKNVTIF